MTSPTRPIMRYHGGKWRLAPWVIAHLPRTETYVEPFGGAGSVLLRRERSTNEVLNDLDDEVVNVFRVLRDDAMAARLREQLALTPYSRAEFHLSYEVADDPVESARRRLVRAAMAFGSSSARRHRSGFRDAPRRERGGNGMMNFAELPDVIPAFTSRLRGVCVEQRLAVDVIRRQDGLDTLFYCDPPYPMSTRSSIRTRGDNDRAYRCDMTDDDHWGLAGALHSARGAVVLSGYPCDLYDRELFPTWERVTKGARGDGAVARTEVLWMNSRAVELLRAQSAPLMEVRHGR